MEIALRHPFLEETLAAWDAALGPAREAYRGHAYRVFNAARRIHGDAASDDLLAAASAFHDLGIWSDRTFDYLAPSVARATEFCREREIDAGVVARAIELHHALRAPRGPLEDAFRRADLVDVSRGWLRAGLDRAFVRELVATWPYAGFHGIIVRAALAWIVRHPLRPLPMLR
jgi:hypothetical protein